VTTISFVNGTFDILHPGHLKLFNYAKTMSDWLIVAIDSDDMVRKLKGKNRPINNQMDRKFFLENLRSVDAVHIFNSHNELRDLINSIRPDIMIVGEDWHDKEVVGSEYARELKFFPRIGNYSTTRTIERITDR
jgi:rfaE bifunctional protein nucleotidyltransferase chain/domain